VACSDGILEFIGHAVELFLQAFELRSLFPFDFLHCCDGRFDKFLDILNRFCALLDCVLCLLGHRLDFHILLDLCQALLKVLELAELFVCLLLFYTFLLLLNLSLDFFDRDFCCDEE
jgi:hypothetical protein